MYENRDFSSHWVFLPRPTIACVKNRQVCFEIDVVSDVLFNIMDDLCLTCWALSFVAALQSLLRPMFPLSLGQPIHVLEGLKLRVPKWVQEVTAVLHAKYGGSKTSRLIEYCQTGVPCLKIVLANLCGSLTQYIPSHLRVIIEFGFSDSCEFESSGLKLMLLFLVTFPGVVVGTIEERCKSACEAYDVPGAVLLLSSRCSMASQDRSWFCIRCE